MILDESQLVVVYLVSKFKIENSLKTITVWNS